MIYNQASFDKKYHKTLKKVEFEDRKFQGQLVIKDYSELEDLYLQNVKSAEKVVLRNLTQLQNCTIWDCNAKELAIENCPRIKKLKVRKNSLINLNFLTNLNNLEELDIDDNPQLIELLKPYNGDWKTWKEVQKISKENPEQLAKRLWDLQAENKKLVELKDKESIIPNNPTDFEKKYQELKRFLHSLTSEEKLKTKEIAVLKTKDLTDTLSGKISDQERNLSQLQETVEEYEEKLRVYEADKNRIIQKEKQLEELKKTVANNKPEITDDLEELLEAQQENNQKWLKRSKNRLIKQITEEKVNDLCQLQRKITQLKSNINQQVQQINQIINNYYDNSRVYHNSKHNEFNNNRFDQVYFEVAQQEIPLKTK